MRKEGILSVLGIGLLILIISVWSSITIVDPGKAKVGIFFGETVKTYNEGFHFKNPLERTKEYTVRRESMSYEGEVLTNDQVSLDLDINVPYRINYQTLVKFHSRIGHEYREQLLSPIVNSATRDAVATISWEDLAKNTQGRDKLTETINKELNKKMIEDLKSSGFSDENAKKVVQIYDVQVSSVNPPKRIRQAVEEKKAAEQQLKQQETLTSIAEEEAKRRAIQGQGVKQLIDELPQDYTAQELSLIISSMAERQRAQAMNKAVETQQAQNIHIYGDSAPAAAPNGGNSSNN